MAVTIERGATIWVGDPVTMIRGSASDITTVGSFHTQDPAYHPTVADFTDAAQLVTSSSDPLWAGTVEVLTRIGPRGEVTLEPGDHQRWIRLSTADEDVLVASGTVSIA